MNMPHKLPDEWLLSYAAGALNPGRSLMVASHVSYHDDLQEAVADAEAIGGTLLESMEAANLNPVILDQLMARLDDQVGAAVAPEVRPTSIAGGRYNFPEPLLEFLDCDVDALKWQFVAPGLKQVNLWKGANNERLWMLRAKGGMSIPEHGHEGDEWALILKGSYETALGHYGVGEIDLADEEVVHRPAIDEHEECICLVFSEGSIRPTNPALRLMQPLFRL